MKFKDSQLTMDVSELIESMSDKDKRFLGKFIAFDDILIEAICKWLATGEIDWDDDNDNPWWTGSSEGKSTVLQKAKTALMPLMDDVANRFIAELINDRDYWKGMANQYQNELWSLQRIWRDGTYPPVNNFDYSQPTMLTKEQVKERITAFIAAHSAPPDLESVDN